MRPLFWVVFSIITPTFSDMNCFLNSFWRVSSSSWRVWERCFIMFEGVFGVIFSAGVFFLGLKLKTCILANCAKLAISMVCLKSSSVSVGKPTIISVVIAGRSSFVRNLSTVWRKSSAEYWRHIFFRIFCEPDWRGRCRWGTMLGWAQMQSRRVSVRSAGSRELSLSLFRSGSCASDSMRSVRL